MNKKTVKTRPELILVTDYKERFIWFECGRSFTHSLAEGIIKILNKLDKDSCQPIIFYIKGIGGDFYAFVKLAHAIERLKSSVVFIAFDFVKSGCFLITQSGKKCLAMADTKFTFHQAVDFLPKNEIMSQKKYLEGYSRLKQVDSLQFWIFTRKGTPVRLISDLFEQEATISTQEAIKLGLVENVYDEIDFRKDKKRAEEMARVKYKF
ncbi:MAG: hypothetical protein COV30_00255 [Candidatus Yanofskybacteria bacterium CG10_big_fil_rev_8_21_14_0_10_37_15]|uniref:ATP-dependent Clp protease proteolytic subunit n=1 Tax=Candidatus Yanofskybacteria bacterium CG10_big_fil_rev_8_21_14_0_10_37_15 TaxID=1975097 RepID=A0A2H0R6H5_9BACT|nr:MAG: hypothetical protein COV30_00255 [Candidatus Yanofskybacteria bacterium CG10_big_fil_rev_8_21_14_0_10_37_15]